MKTLGELYDALTELSHTMARVSETESAIGRGGDAQTIERKRQELWRARDHIDELRAKSLDELNLSNRQQRLL